MWSSSGVWPQLRESQGTPETVPCHQGHRWKDGFPTPLLPTVSGRGTITDYRGEQWGTTDQNLDVCLPQLLSEEVGFWQVHSFVCRLREATWGTHRRGEGLSHVVTRPW